MRFNKGFEFTEVNIDGTYAQFICMNPLLCFRMMHRCSKCHKVLVLLITSGDMSLNVRDYVPRKD